MFIDALLLLSDAQALTVTAVSTNTIDLGSVTPARIGDGEPLALTVTIDVGADFTTTDETYTFELISSAAANLGTPTVLGSRTISAAALALKAGTMVTVNVPVNTPTQRYIGARYTLGGTTPLLTVTAFIQPMSMIERMTYYPGVF